MEQVAQSVCSTPGYQQCATANHLTKAIHADRERSLSQLAQVRIVTNKHRCVSPVALTHRHHQTLQAASSNLLHPSKLAPQAGGVANLMTNQISEREALAPIAPSSSFLSSLPHQPPLVFAICDSSDHTGSDLWAFCSTIVVLSADYHCCVHATVIRIGSRNLEHNLAQHS
jgi:hypothetical protein